MRSKIVPILLNSVPGWVRSNYGLLVPSVVTHYDEGRAWVQGFGTVDPTTLITTVRASVGYAATSAGGLNLFQANTPRITDLGLLVEQAATNLALRSQDFSNAYWTKNNSTAAAAASTAPDGTVTASSFIEAANTAQHSIFSLNAVALTSGVTYTVSTYVKVLSGTRSFVLFPQGGGSADAVFNLQLGTVTSTGGSQYVSSGIAALGSGWYRCWVTFTASSTANNSPNLYLSNDGTASPSYAGDGASGVYLWGFQFETGSFPTSYIPTTTVSVTRAADAITRSRTNPTTFSRVFSAVAAPGILGTNEFLWAFSDGGGTNNIQVYRDGVGHIIAKAIAGGVTYANLDLGLVANSTAFKVGIRMTASGFSAVLNGGSVSTGAGTAPTGMVTEYIGSDRSGGNQWDSVRKRDTEFSTGLADGQLQALTA